MIRSRSDRVLQEVATPIFGKWDGTCSAHRLNRPYMRTISTLATLSALFLSLSAGAQLVTVIGPDGQEVTSTELVINGDPDAGSIDVGLSTLLNGEVPKSVNLVRYEMDVIHGSQNYFCWGECWAPQNAGARPVWYAMTPVDLEPGISGGGFHAYWAPNGLTGCTKFRFVWFNVDDRNDSSWVDVRFCSIEGMGVGEVAKPSFSMFPNPAVGSTVQVQFDQVAGVSSRMVIYDVLGGRVGNHRLAKGQERMDLSTDGLAPGVYFATLEENGRAVMTRRLVVQR